MTGLRAARVVACLAACLPAVGCGDDEGPARYVGAVSGTDAFVAAVTDGERVVAYVCDGVPGEKAATVQAWFDGASDGRRIDVPGVRGGRLLGRLADDAMSGTVVLPDGRRLSYRMPRARGSAGLYRGEAEGVLAGWIVAADGRQRGSLIGKRLQVVSLRVAIPLTASPPALVVSKNTQGLVPSPLTAEDFNSVSKG
jgi:hypothetical protein